ncbi:MAG: hypothetical protein NTV00_05830 [Methylococcales bacterium]|nr:hypothetical protein [Methylococcales bacterium]
MPSISVSLKNKSGVIIDDTVVTSTANVLGQSNKQLTKAGV